MVAMPVPIPDTMPVDNPTVATVGLLLVQIPPEVASESVMTDEVHWLVGPLMAATVGTGLMVITEKDEAVPQLVVTM